MTLRKSKKLMKTGSKIDRAIETFVGSWSFGRFM